MTAAKPPYRVPSMAEIAAIPWNGLTVVSTFAGAGGSSTGYRMAGYRVLLANEFVPIAQDSYEANMGPHTVLAREDIKALTASTILKRTGLKRRELDVLDGSPPCQAFSTAGRREKGWGTDKVYEHGASQKNEELFFDYVRLLRGLEPRAFVAENVSGLVKGTAKGFFLEILRELKASGYRVQAPLLDAQWLGVPQARQRIVFMGVREDLGIDPPTIAPLPYRYSVRDALPWLKRLEFTTGGDHQALSPVRSVDAPVQTIATANDRHFKVEAETDISRFAIGDEYDKLNPGQQSDRFFSLVRADADAPSPTIIASGGNFPSGAQVVHPTEKRRFSIAEVKRLCSFPDDFVLKGTFGQQWERLGNSVPPVMMFRVAEAIRDGVLIPARARTPGPGPRSAGRSKTGKRPKDAGKRPPSAAPAAARRIAVPAATRTPGRRSRQAGRSGGASGGPS